MSTRTAPPISRANHNILIGHITQLYHPESSSIIKYLSTWKAIYDIPKQKYFQVILHHIENVKHTGKIWIIIRISCFSTAIASQGSTRRGMYLLQRN